MIKDYFKGKTILITGTTGFLGKVLLERILWEAPEVQCVRLLSRPGHGKGSSHERARSRLVQSLMKSQAFDRLRSRHPDFRAFLDQKTQVFACDLFEEDLGLTYKDQVKIFKDLDAVIHIAACVSWDERFDYSVRVNTLAAARLLEMAGQTEPRPRFVHVSSAFVHGQRSGEVFEEPFDPKVSIANELGENHPFDIEREIRSALEQADKITAEAEHPSMQSRFARDAAVLAVIPKYAGLTLDQRVERAKQRYVRSQMSGYGRRRARLHGWIDSYTFSKAMAEMLLTQRHGDVPLTIIRPPGITSALEHPTPGWLEGYHLVEPLIEGVGRGMITSFPGDPNTIVDTVPVDQVVNLIMAACAREDAPAHPCVFQIGASHTNPITLKEISGIWLKYFQENPMTDAAGHPIKTTPPKFFPDPEAFVRFYQRQRKLPLSMAGSLLERIPFSGKIAPLRKARTWIEKQCRQIDRLCQFSNLYSAYTVNSWVFTTHKTQELLKSLPEADRAHFCFDTGKLDWNSYWTQTHIPGMRRFVITQR